MIVPSYFSTLAQSQNLQFLLDTSQQNLDSQSMWRAWLDVGVPQMSLNFDAAIGRERIAAAASVVDSDSPAPMRSRNKLELYKGKIPAIKEKFRMTQDDMRSIEVLRALPIVNTGAAPLIAFLNKDLQEAAVAGDKRIDMMLLQAVSTLTINVNATNNPDGAAFGTIDLLAQPYQKQGVPTVWTDLANADPITDIENFLTYNWKQRGRQFGKILMSYECWLNFKSVAKVKTFLATFFNTGKTASSFAVTLANVNEMLGANMWPPIELVNHVSNVEVDGFPTFIRAFDSFAVSFVPVGKLGTLFNAISMEEVHPVLDKSYAKYGPTLVSKWAESDPLCEYTAMEMNAFPSINIDTVFVLTTNVVQASFI